MKSCPYCAEQIQEAAAKCRYCGEWLDPSKQPAWSLGGVGATPAEPPASPPQAAPVAAPAESTPQPARAPQPQARFAAPAAFTPPGAPVAEREPAAPATAPAPAAVAERPHPSWEAPAAWLSHPPQADAAPTPRAPVHVETPIARAPLSRDTLPEGVVRRDALAREEGASLEEVALRMQRIQASAAAVRRAVEIDASLGPGDSSSQTRVDGPRTGRTMVSPPAMAPTTGWEPELTPTPSQADVMALEPQPVATHTQPVATRTQPAVENPGPAPISAAMPAPVASPDGYDDDFAEDDEFDAAGFGGFEDDEDEANDYDSDMSGFGDLQAAPRAVPWRPILLGAAVVLIATGFLFRDRIFGGSDAAGDATAPDAEVAEHDESGDVREGSVAPKAAIAPTPAPGEGQPVTPEGAVEALETGGVQPAEEGDAADEVAPAPTVPGAPVQVVLDPDTLAKLDEARETFKSANGRRGKLSAAQELLEEILAKSPDHPEALLILAQVQLEQGAFDESLASATRCTEVAADQAGCWLAIGAIKQDRKDAEAATMAYEKYLALAPDGRYAGDVRRQLKRLQ